ncbi:MAG: hypothetical protein R3F20_01995 [Planctomycetota bacterium]
MIPKVGTKVCTLAALLVLSAGLHAQDLPVLREVTPVPTTSPGYLTGRLAALGDVDGDGVDDFAIQLRDANPVFPAQVWHQHSGATGQFLYALPYAGTYVDDYWYGGVADLDADGRADVARVYKQSASSFGPELPPLVAATSGATGTLLWTLPLGAVGVRFAGAEVLSAGDLNGDGRDDLAILTLGVDGGDPATTLDDSPTAIRFLDGATGVVLHEIIDAARIVNALAAIGDTNGDGVGDFAIGAAHSGWNGPDAGGAALLDGASFAYTQFWTGGQAAEGMGLSVVAAGDRDGDLRGDVVVGSANGIVRIFSGAGGALIESHQIASSPVPVVIQGGASFDWDGDGVDDFRAHLLGPNVLEVRSGVDFGLLASFPGRDLIHPDSNGDGFAERVFATASTLQPVRFETGAGAQTFGAPSGALTLSWQRQSPAAVQGAIRIEGGTPFASAILAGSLGVDDTTIVGTSLPLYLDVTPSRLFLQAVIGLDASGVFEASLSLVAPALDGVVLSFQAAETGAVPQTTGGLQLRFRG